MSGKHCRPLSYATFTHWDIDKFHILNLAFTVCYLLGIFGIWEFNFTFLYCENQHYSHGNQNVHQECIKVYVDIPILEEEKNWLVGKGFFVFGGKVRKYRKKSFPRKMFDCLISRTAYSQSDIFLMIWLKKPWSEACVFIKHLFLLWGQNNPIPL